MKRIVLISVVILLFGWALYDFIGAKDHTKNNLVQDKIVAMPPDQDGEMTNLDESGLDVGKLSPEFELETLTGKTVRLSDYRGKRVIINFWATWCPPCRAEIPDFQKLYNNHDVVILAVNLTQSEKSEEHVTEFVNDFEMTFPVLMDEQATVSTTYQVQAYPTSYMVDSNGHIQYLAMGPMNYDLMVQQMEGMD